MADSAAPASGENGSPAPAGGGKQQLQQSQPNSNTSSSDNTTAAAAAAAAAAAPLTTAQPAPQKESAAATAANGTEAEESETGPAATANNNSSGSGGGSGSGSNNNSNGTVAAPARKKPITFPKLQQLTRAVSQGQMGRVRLLVENEMARAVKEPEAYNVMLRHIAMFAAAYKETGIMDYVLAKLPAGTRVNSLSAAAREEAKAVSGLLDNKIFDKASVDMGKGGMALVYKLCPVYAAVLFAREDLALQLLARPDDPVAAKPSTQGQAVEGLLHVACRLGLLRVVKALVAPPHAVPVLGNDNGAGASPLCLALQHNRVDVVRFLCAQLREQCGAGAADAADTAELVRAVNNPLGKADSTCWAAAIVCLRADALDALQALLQELPDTDSFFASPAPLTYAASNAALRCLRWLIEQHGALSQPVPGLLHLVCGGKADEDKCLLALQYLVDGRGLDVDARHDRRTAAEVALRNKRPKLHEYLTRGKRQAAVRVVLVPVLVVVGWLVGWWVGRSDRSVGC
jgi:hypothetical protein